MDAHRSLILRRAWRKWRRLAQPVDLVRGDRAREAFELEVAGRRGLERLLHGSEQALADQDLPRGGDTCLSTDEETGATLEQSQAFSG